MQEEIFDKINDITAKILHDAGLLRETFTRLKGLSSVVDIKRLENRFIAPFIKKMHESIAKIREFI